MKSTVRVIPFAVLAALAFGCSTQPTSDSPATPGQSPAASSSSPSGQAAPSRGVAGDAMKDPKAALTSRSIYYDFDKYDIKAESRDLIQAHARYLREHPEVKVRIEGNADERGSSEYNLALGQRRAEVVASTLKLLGIPESRMEAVSFGKEKPRKTGHDETSWAENRRSDLVY
jgi:peptidoglycan-associated lipoprotein